MRKASLEKSEGEYDGHYAETSKASEDNVIRRFLPTSDNQSTDDHCQYRERSRQDKASRGEERINHFCHKAI